MWAVRECRGPLSERQVAGEDHAAVLVATRNDVEEQVGLVATERQIAELVDDQQLRSHDGAIEVLLEPTLHLGGRELDHEIRRGEEARLDAGHDRTMPERDGEMG